VGKGTGLGLSICYGIITEHGGTIHVHNVPQHGASFRIELPFQAVNSAQALNAGAPELAGRDGRILVVDDDESILETVAAILRGRSHVVTTARSVHQALSLIEDQEFDLILADVQVARVQEGVGLREWIAAHKPALSQRLVWMSATPSAEDTNTVPCTESSRLLQKPFKAVDLLAEVDQRLSEIDVAPLQR